MSDADVAAEAAVIRMVTPDGGTVTANQNHIRVGIDLHKKDIDRNNTVNQ